MTTDTPDLTALSDDALSDEIERRRAALTRDTATSGDELADAVRRFLQIDVVARAVATDPSWGSEWLQGPDGLRISDVQHLAHALANHDAARATSPDTPGGPDQR